MSRFGNLEFGSAREHTPKQESLLKDESYFLGQAQANFENGRFEQALREFAKVLEFNPKSGAAWCGQVRSLIDSRGACAAVDFLETHNIRSGSADDFGQLREVVGPLRCGVPLNVVRHYFDAQHCWGRKRDRCLPRCCVLSAACWVRELESRVE